MGVWWVFLKCICLIIIAQVAMEMEKLPYYLFLIIRPDGNTAFSRIHEQYPLELDINQLLTLGSNLNNLNTMQAAIIHPDIRSNRKEELDLAKNTSIKAINTSTFQMRFLDTISGYMFILSAPNAHDARKLDGKLELVYRNFVDFVIKGPFFNVRVDRGRVLRRWTTPPSCESATRSSTLTDTHTITQDYSLISAASPQLP